MLNHRYYTVDIKPLLNTESNRLKGWIKCSSQDVKRQLEEMRCVRVCVCARVCVWRVQIRDLLMRFVFCVFLNVNLSDPFWVLEFGWSIPLTPFLPPCSLLLPTSCSHMSAVSSLSRTVNRQQFSSRVHYLSTALNLHLFQILVSVKPGPQDQWSLV